MLHHSVSHLKPLIISGTDALVSKLINNRWLLQVIHVNRLLWLNCFWQMESSHANSSAMFGSDLKILCRMDESSCASFYKYITCQTCRVHLILQGNNWFSDRRRVDDHDVLLRRQENRLAFPNGSQNIFAPPLYVTSG